MQLLSYLAFLGKRTSLMLLIESPYMNKDRPFRVNINQTNEFFHVLGILITIECLKESTLSFDSIINFR